MLECVGEEVVSAKVQLQAVVIRVDKSEAGCDFGHPPTHCCDALLLAERHVFFLLTGMAVVFHKTKQHNRACYKCLSHCARRKSVRGEFGAPEG